MVANKPRLVYQTVEKKYDIKKSDRALTIDACNELGCTCCSRGTRASVAFMIPVPYSVRRLILGPLSWVSFGKRCFKRSA